MTLAHLRPLRLGTGIQAFGLLPFLFIFGLSACSLPDRSGEGTDPLPPNRYLASPSAGPTVDFAIDSDGHMQVAAGANPFSDRQPVVCIGGKAPAGMKLSVVYFARRPDVTDTSLALYRLSDSHLFDMKNPQQLGDTTIYPVDWSFICEGMSPAPTDGYFTIPAHGLKPGDTVYLAAASGNETLASGAYVVQSVPDSNTFTLYHALITPGDAFNYLARVNDSPEAVAF